MKITEPLKRKLALIALLAPIALLVVAAPFVENANATRAAEAAEAAELHQAARTEAKAESEERLAAMTCDELHADLDTIALEMGSLEKLYDEAFEDDEASNDSEPRTVANGLDQFMADLPQMMRDTAESRSAPLEAQIEARCPNA